MEPYIPFKLRTIFEKRLEISTRIHSLYPDRVPVVVEPRPRNTDFFPMKKFLTPPDIPVSKFIAEVRKGSSTLPHDKALTFYFAGNLVPLYMSMCDVYQRYRDEDGFLYVIYCEESCFGAV